MGIGSSNHCCSNEPGCKGIVSEAAAGDPLPHCRAPMQSPPEKEPGFWIVSTKTFGIVRTELVFVNLPSARDEAWQMQTVMVHYDGEFVAAANSLRSVAKGLDPALKVDVQRLEDNLAPYRTISQITAEVAGVLGLLAVG